MIRFLFFSIRFLIFWVRFRFSEKVLNSRFVDRFSLFFDPFLHISGPFPAFKKSFKFLVCCSVSCFFDLFPHTFGQFPVFRKSSLFLVHTFDQFPLVSGFKIKYYGFGFYRSFNLLLYENLKLFLKTRHGPKKNEETDRKKEETDQHIRYVYTHILKNLLYNSNYISWWPW